MYEIIKGHPCKSGHVRTYTVTRVEPGIRKTVDVLAMKGRDALEIAHALFDGKASPVILESI